MKPVNLFLVILFTLVGFSCQSSDGFDVSGREKLSHEPTGVKYVDIADISLKIDFSTDVFIGEAISYRKPYLDNEQVIKADLFDVFSTFSQLIEYYGRCDFGYRYGYESFRSAFDGETLYPSIEYALAQECFRDDCSTETRKAVLRMALDKHERKMIPFLLSSTTRRTGLFLIGVILVMERDAAFLSAIRKNEDVRNILCLNLDTERQLSVLDRDNGVDFVVCEIAENFLLKIIE